MRRRFAAVLVGWFVAGGVQADVFDPATNTLSIPTLQIGSTIFENARLLLIPNGQWSVQSLGTVRVDTSTTTTTTASTLTILPAAINAKVGENITVTAGGGTPPYTFSASNSNLGFLYKSGNTAVFAVYGIGSATIVVTDSAGKQATTGTTVASSLVVVPTTISGVVGDQLTIHFGNGAPPYTVGTSNSTIAKAGEVTYHTPNSGSVTIYTYRAGSASIFVQDSYGNLQGITLTVTTR